MKEINLTGFTDLTQGKGEVRNYYNPITKAHYYKGKFWSREEWSEWIHDSKAYEQFNTTESKFIL